MVPIPSQVAEIEKLDPKPLLLPKTKIYCTSMTQHKREAELASYITLRFPRTECQLQSSADCNRVLTATESNGSRVPVQLAYLGIFFKIYSRKWLVKKVQIDSGELDTD